MENFNNFYKFKGGLAVTNMLYEPLVSNNKKIFCMNWNANKYFENAEMTDELYNYWFSREVMYLFILKNKNYIPEVINIDYKKRKITFRWYDKSLHWLLKTRQINSIPNWQDKIKAIKDDLEKDNIYKINMYPHTFYFDDEDNAHIMDLYGCTDVNTKYLDVKHLKPLIRNDRFDKFIVDDQLDTHELYNETIRTNYAEWPGDFLNA